MEQNRFWEILKTKFNFKDEKVKFDIGKLYYNLHPFFCCWNCIPAPSSCPSSESLRRRAKAKACNNSILLKIFVLACFFLLQFCGFILIFDSVYTGERKEKPETNRAFPISFFPIISFYFVSFPIIIISNWNKKFARRLQLLMIYWSLDNYIWRGELELLLMVSAFWYSTLKLYYKLLKI